MTYYTEKQYDIYDFALSRSQEILLVIPILGDNFRVNSSRIFTRAVSGEVKDYVEKIYVRDVLLSTAKKMYMFDMRTNSLEDDGDIEVIFNVLYDTFMLEYKSSRSEIGQYKEFSYAGVNMDTLKDFVLKTSERLLNMYTDMVSYINKMKARSGASQTMTKAERSKFVNMIKAYRREHISHNGSIANKRVIGKRLPKPPVPIKSHKLQKQVTSPRKARKKTTVGKRGDKRVCVKRSKPGIFFRFMADKSESIRKDHKVILQTEVAKIASAMWHKLPAKDKAKYCVKKK